ncbi:hypothetical protein TCON_0656 [Astathelohania contejeani]|uniref:Uncharacterized protein n=1 Tax=Astathelohania contejeani TaxID=164912 RepID=A0ABQ7I132_9MICR|nr:hypothetical protein TCON_0656 [Thelohania contejeani]
MKSSKTTAISLGICVLIIMIGLVVYDMLSSIPKSKPFYTNNTELTASATSDNKESLKQKYWDHMYENLAKMESEFKGLPNMEKTSLNPQSSNQKIVKQDLKPSKVDISFNKNVKNPLVATQDYSTGIGSVLDFNQGEVVDTSHGYAVPIGGIPIPKGVKPTIINLNTQDPKLDYMKMVMSIKPEDVLLSKRKSLLNEALKSNSNDGFEVIGEEIKKSSNGKATVITFKKNSLSANISKPKKTGPKDRKMTALGSKKESESSDDLIDTIQNGRMFDESTTSSSTTEEESIIKLNPKKRLEKEKEEERKKKMLEDEKQKRKEQQSDKMQWKVKNSNNNEGKSQHASEMSKPILNNENSDKPIQSHLEYINSHDYKHEDPLGLLSTPNNPKNEGSNPNKILLNKELPYNEKKINATNFLSKDKKIFNKIESESGKPYALIKNEDSGDE